MSELDDGQPVHEGVPLSVTAPAYTSPGQDFLAALQDELSEHQDALGDEVIRAIVERMPWKNVTPEGRAVFGRMALRFLSEEE